MSLWSVSVPDESVPQKLGQGTDLFCLWSAITVRLWNIQHGKYSDTGGVTNWVNYSMTLADVFQTRPRTGVEFWTRVQQRMLELNTNELQTQMKLISSDPELRVVQVRKWYPTFRWEGDDLIWEAKKSVTYDENAQGMGLGFPLKVAQAFGLTTYDAVSKKWKLGPNMVPSYPTYEQPPPDVSDALASTLQGPTRFLPPPRLKDGRYHPTWEWFRTYYHDPTNTNVQMIIFSKAVEWRMIHLNSSYQRLTNQLDTVMVYTDAVQSNAVNHLNVPLLRSLHLTRGGQGRVTVEPKHREWIPLNGNTLETLEFQCATPSGPLTDLSPGQTILTVGLKPIKTER